MQYQHDGVCIMGCLRAGSCECGSGVLVIAGGTENLSVVLHVVLHWRLQVWGLGVSAAARPVAADVRAPGSPGRSRWRSFGGSSDPDKRHAGKHLWPRGADGWQNLDRHSQHL
jgi:hypothetical protein